MRSLLFLLIGLALACLIGFAMFDAPAPRIEDAAPLDAASITSPPLALFGLLILGSWATLLIRDSSWLRMLLFVPVVAIGALVLLAGAFSAYWDHYMRPGETVGWWGIGTGVLMLLSQIVVWLRATRAWDDEGP
jgi:hypothetical protein